jgi:hypothetical protein
MKKISDSLYIETLKDVTNKLEDEIKESISTKGFCDLYIAVLNNSKHSEIFANETSLFLGTENSCKRLFKEILKKLKTSNYSLDGDFKDVVYIKKAC